MAIFYDHIKGVGDSGSTTTYITFQNNDGEYPTISVGTSPLGKILTNSGSSQTIVSNKQLQFGDSSHYIQYDNSNQLILAAGSNHIYLKDNAINITGNTTINGTTNFTGNIVSNINVSGSGLYISAPYFVATSDKRYKENFKPLPSVLDFITSTSLYTFNYKSSPEDRNIGIIAQDVENYSLDDFNLVLNISTKNGEFKAVKESKIPYILWKGIQEESGKISRLEEENAALAKKVDKLEKVVEQLIKLTGLEVINELTEE